MTERELGSARLKGIFIPLLLALAAVCMPCSQCSCALLQQVLIF